MALPNKSKLLLQCGPKRILSCQNIAGLQGSKTLGKENPSTAPMRWLQISDRLWGLPLNSSKIYNRYKALHFYLSKQNRHYSSNST